MERFYGYGVIIFQGWYLAIQRDALVRDPLEGYLRGRQRAVDHNLVPPLHLVPCVLVEGVVRGQD